MHYEEGCAGWSVRVTLNLLVKVRDLSLFIPVNYVVT